MNSYKKVYSILIEAANERGKTAGTKERAKKLMKKGTGWGSLLVQQRARTRGIGAGAAEKRRKKN